MSAMIAASESLGRNFAESSGNNKEDRQAVLPRTPATHKADRPSVSGSSPPTNDPTWEETGSFLPGAPSFPPSRIAERLGAAGNWCRAFLGQVAVSRRPPFASPTAPPQTARAYQGSLSCLSEGRGNESGESTTTRGTPEPTRCSERSVQPSGSSVVSGFEFPVSGPSNLEGVKGDFVEGCEAS